MRPATLLVSALLSTLAQSCAPPKPTEPESTAVYREPTAAAPVPITRLSVNEPTPEPLGAAAPVEPAAAATPSATSEDAASKSAEPAPASPAPAAPVPAAPAPAGPSTAPSATPSPPGGAPSPPPAKK